MCRWRIDSSASQRRPDQQTTSAAWYQVREPEPQGPDFSLPPSDPIASQAGAERLLGTEASRELLASKLPGYPSGECFLIPLRNPYVDWFVTALLIAQRRLGRVIPEAFHRNGKPILSYHGAWRAACERASTLKRDGLVTVVRSRLLGRTPHDFRRTAARNLIRAGVPQHVVMKLCGWKTDAMFRRYAIVDERDLRDAVAKLASLNAPKGIGRKIRPT